MLCQSSVIGFADGGGDGSGQYFVDRDDAIISDVI